MTLVEIIGNQHLRILALEETVAQLQNQNSKLQERIVILTPKPVHGCPLVGCQIVGEHTHAMEGPVAVLGDNTMESGLNPVVQNKDSIGT
jgi:hypothetical protein